MFVLRKDPRRPRLPPETAQEGVKAKAKLRGTRRVALDPYTEMPRQSTLTACKNLRKSLLISTLTDRS